MFVLKDYKPGAVLTFACSSASLGAILDLWPAIRPFAPPGKLSTATQTSFNRQVGFPSHGHFTRGPDSLAAVRCPGCREIFEFAAEKTDFLGRTRDRFPSHYYDYEHFLDHW